MKSWVVLVALAACGDDAGTLADGDVPDADLTDAPAGCACTYGAPSGAGAITIAGAVELSGLAASHTIADTVWTHNDSGDTARLFAITTTGGSKGIGTLQGAIATDWEDIAAAPCGAATCLYVADIGDNALARATVRIYEVDEPAQIQGAANLTYRAFDVAYPDGPHNAEAMVVDPRDGASYVITKQASNPSTVFRMPRTAGVTATAVSIGTIAIPGAGNLLVTAADLHADECGVHLLVRTYDKMFELRAPATATIAELVATAPLMVPVATEIQGEAVAYLPDGRGYLTVSEGTSPQLSKVVCN